MGKDDGFHEHNPLYKNLSNVEAGIALIGTNWLIERAITGIKDKRLRNAIGWLATSIEFGYVYRNFQAGIRIRF
jgi:hypothetical protein